MTKKTTEKVLLLLAIIRLLKQKMETCLNVLVESLSPSGDANMKRSKPSERIMEIAKEMENIGRKSEVEDMFAAILQYLDEQAEVLDEK